MLRQIGTRTVRAASTVSINMADHGVAIMALNAPPVNTLNATLCSEISSSINSIVSDKASAIVLTSAKPGVFSSGLDIFSMYDKENDLISAFF